MNKLITIKLQWGLLRNLCYPSISIWWSRLWIIPNTLDPPSEAFVIWCLVSYTRYTSSMLHILHQIYIFVNSRLGSSQPNLHTSNRVSELSLQDVYPSSPVAIGLPAFGLCHLANTLAIQWRSWYLIIRGGGQLRPTSSSISPPTVVFKGGKPYALISRQSANRLDNLSCVYISEWEYIFRVTYVLRWQQRLFT